MLISQSNVSNLVQTDIFPFSAILTVIFYYNSDSKSNKYQTFIFRLLFYLTSKLDIWMKRNLYVLVGVGWCKGKISLQRT